MVEGSGMVDDYVESMYLHTGAPKTMLHAT